MCQDVQYVLFTHKHGLCCCVRRVSRPRPVEDGDDEWRLIDAGHVDKILLSISRIENNRFDSFCLCAGCREVPGEVQ